MTNHFSDPTVFRTGTGAEVLEVVAPYGRSTSFGVSMDSFDAPEIGLRLDYDSAKALAEWLVSRLSELDDHRAPVASSDAECAGVRVTGQMSAILCDDDGWVRSGTFHWGTDYKCTGSVHPPLDSPIWPGHEIRCANPIHVVKLPLATNFGSVTITTTPPAHGPESTP